MPTVIPPERPREKILRTIGTLKRKGNFHMLDALLVPHLFFQLLVEDLSADEYIEVFYDELNDTTYFEWCGAVIKAYDLFLDGGWVLPYLRRDAQH